MATVEKYSVKSAYRWRVRYRTPDRRQTDKRGFKTKRDADAFRATVEVSKLRGEFVPERAGRVTVGELAPDWLARKEQSTAPSNYRMYESAWRVHVATPWGHRRVADITVVDVEQWIANLCRDGSGSTTVRRAHGVLSGVLDDAVKSRRLAVNPAKGIDNLPRKTARRHVYLTSDDVHRLAREAREHKSLVLVLAFCGLRWGEAIALEVQDIEFPKRRLRISKNAVQLGVDHAVGEPKGREARSVPVPDFVLEEQSRLCHGREPDGLVFPGRNGGYLPRPKSSGGWFSSAVTRATIQKVTPHDLRHTAASLSVSAGANVLALARMLGHKDPSVTLTIYADLFDSDLDAVAASLNATYSPDNVGKMWALPTALTVD